MVRAIHTVKPEPVEEAQSPPLPPPKRGRKSSQKTAKAVKQEVEEEQNEDAKPAPKRRRKASNKVNSYKEEEQEDKEEGETYKQDSSDESATEKPAAKKKRGGGGGGKRAKKPKEPIVYIIPDVPRRDFRLEGPPEKRAERSNGYSGRLGFACLNTVLRNEDPPKFCSRNVRIKTIQEKGLDYVKDLARQNVLDIIPLLEWNAANNIRMMRLSSEIFPFASHDVYGYDISFAAKELAEAGAAAKRLDQRLTMHPGQFCQLGTPKQSVLEASLRELDVHAKVLDLMGVGSEGVMILHGGGTFGDREATLERIRDTINNRLSPSVRSRLVLENDELGYSAEELLPLCESLDPPVPLVFDFHHDMLRPSSLSPAEIIERAEAIFAKRGVPPKYHLSEPRPGAANSRDRRAHSDRCAELPPDLPADADLMLECKDKEQGVLEMFRIYGLHDVQHDVLRPPANDLTMSTAGRRSKLDGQGGATHPNPARRSPKKENGEEQSESEVEPSPKKKRETDHSLIERLIEKAKVLAAKRGKEYKGPRSQSEIDQSKEGLATSIEVKRDMEMQADWIRAELRAGRERRPFPGSADAQAELNKPESQSQPEPDAY
ncbi:UvdE-domain-containing protein [Meira miltonrushii]|uniref:UvdE-domain-containing protein n=1 Tax=Meira miltonrushii TaxID=1280837 RepID=A0A316VLA0_9BASI|nr:UvdE-domain-containing protein [Meira miltonrushii]PWN37848.1 UvdE-domain-containing protein [Meira miltonrushii]